MKMTRVFSVAFFVGVLAQVARAGMMCPVSGAMPGGHGPSGLTIAVPLLLLAVAAGYAMLVMSQHQQRPLDIVGRWLGSLVLLVAVIGLLCSAVCSLKCRYGGSCGRMGAECHYSTPTQAAPEPDTK